MGFWASLEKTCTAFHTPYHLIVTVLYSHVQFQDSIKNYESKKHSSHSTKTGCRHSKDFPFTFTGPLAEDILIHL